MCTKNYDHMMYYDHIHVPEKWCTTDGQTDGQTKKVKYRGGWPT